MEIKLREVLEREFRNRSVSAAASDCGISSSTLHNWKSGILPTAKNIHHLLTLSEYLGLTLKELLFNVRDESDSDSKILFSSQFSDGGKTYKIIVERKNE